MTDVADGAAAPAEANLVPINEAPANAPGAIDSAGPEKAPAPVVEEQKPAASAREAIDRAFAKVEAKGKEPAKAEAKVDPKVEAKPEAKLRDDAGKFAPKTPAETQQAAPVETKPAPVAEQPAKPTAFQDAPKRFSDDAKAAWQTAPEPVRAEIHRAVKELETGLSQYREVVEPLKPYLDLAKQNNTTINKALDQYMGLERALKSSDINQKLSGIEEVFRHAGISPRDYAAHILNQTPDQVQSQQDGIIRELRQQLSQLQQQVGSVVQSTQQQREQSTLAEINKFAEANPRFEELADDIAFFMKAGRAADLSEAYQLAERLNPAPQQQAPNPAPVIPALLDANAQTKGTKSISGAPTQGSNPSAKRPPAKSNREALDRAFAAVS
jgi:hypothetical protein